MKVSLDMEDHAHSLTEVQTSLFSPELTVAELLRRWPAAIPVFIANRMGCVGCSMAGFETLEDAAHVYGLAYQQFIRELQQAILKSLLACSQSTTLEV